MVRGGLEVAPVHNVVPGHCLSRFVLALNPSGTGDNRGVVLVFFMESTRFATSWLPGLRPVQIAAAREVLIGISLIVVLRWRPAGLSPERIPHPPAWR